MPKPKTVADYGSIYEWVKQEWLLPFLVIGGDEDKFWRLTPNELKFYFEVDRKRKNKNNKRCGLWVSILGLQFPLLS